METMEKLPKSYQSDVVNIQRIGIVPSLLDIIAEVTRMGFVAVARVTDDAWVACSVRDDISFGLKPGGQLEVKTTICSEIKEHRGAVVIDDVKNDVLFCNHHTPAQYGFRSYISVPIIKKDKSFFGTLCAIDPEPNTLNTPAVINLFTHFADLIAFHLQTIEESEYNKAQLYNEQQLHEQSKTEHKLASAWLEQQVSERTKELQQKADALEKANVELQSFTYVASHDLQEPLRKIKFFADRLMTKEINVLSSEGKSDLERVSRSVSRMQALLSDLMIYPQATLELHAAETVNLQELLSDILQELSDEMKQKSAQVHVVEMCETLGIPVQLRQLFYNLIGNSLKFSAPGKSPVIIVSSRLAKANDLNYDKLTADQMYCHIMIADQGIGFAPEHTDKIFKPFQRLHNRDEYAGTGIGLAIVHKVVENHNGFIRVESEIEKGASFHIYIPSNGN